MRSAYSQTSLSKGSSGITQRAAHRPRRCPWAIGYWFSFGSSGSRPVSAGPWVAWPTECCSQRERGPHRFALPRQTKSTESRIRAVSRSVHRDGCRHAHEVRRCGRAIAALCEQAHRCLVAVILLGGAAVASSWFINHSRPNMTIHFRSLSTGFVGTRGNGRAGTLAGSPSPQGSRRNAAEEGLHRRLPHWRGGDLARSPRANEGA